MIVGNAIEGSPEKDAQRGMWKGLYRDHGRRNEGSIVILGGLFSDKKGKIIEDSEVDVWLKSGVPAWAIVSVECNKKVADQCKKNKAGVRVVYMPMSHINNEGDNCPVEWGGIGGIRRVIGDMVAKGEDISLVNADLMATADTLHDTVAGIMESLSKQKSDALLFVNLASLRRIVPKGHKAGKKNVHEALREYEDFRTQERKGKYNKAVWETIGVTINERHSFEYSSCRTPMQSLFLKKTRNKSYVGERPVKVVKIKVKAPKKVKLTSKQRSEACKRAWKTGKLAKIAKLAKAKKKARK